MRRRTRRGVEGEIMENKSDLKPDTAGEYRIGQTLQPWQKINAQIVHLDRALTTIDGQFEESKFARFYITAQIEALKWAAKLWDVG